MCHVNNKACNNVIILQLTGLAINSHGPIQWGIFIRLSSSQRKDNNNVKTLVKCMAAYWTNSRTGGRAATYRLPMKLLNSQTTNTLLLFKKLKFLRYATIWRVTRGQLYILISTPHLNISLRPQPAPHCFFPSPLYPRPQHLSPSLPIPAPTFSVSSSSPQQAVNMR